MNLQVANHGQRTTDNGPTAQKEITMKNHFRNQTVFIFVFSAVFALAFSLQAALLVYEGFDYTPAVSGDPGAQGTGSTYILTGKGGTTEAGLSGTWANADNSGDNMYLKPGSLNFSNMKTSGNHIGYRSNSSSDRYNRSLTTTGFTQPTIYFSFLFEKLQNNFGADHEGFALMNGVLPQARWDNGNAGAVGRDGFAVAAVDNSPNLQAVAYDGTTGTRVVSTYSTDSIPITVVNGGSNTSTSNVAVNLIVGEISFNTGTGGADVFKLYNATDDGSLDAGDLNLITTIEADVDELSLNTLNLTRQVNVNYDEVRIGTTLADVLPAVLERIWAGTGDWNTDAGNWTAAPPTSEDSATISSGTATVSTTESAVSVTVDAGATLVVDGGLTADSVDVAGDLGGVGSITGDVAIKTGGTLAPGNSPGTLTVNGDLLLEDGANEILDINGSQNDLTIVNGNLAFGGTVDLAINPESDFSDGTFTLFTYTGTLTGFTGGASGDGTFTVTYGGDAAKWDLQTATFADTGSAITLTGIAYIPEPSTMILAGLGLLGLTFRRR